MSISENSLKRTLGIIAALLCLSLYSVASFAHKLAPSLLEINEFESGNYTIVWRTPSDASVAPRPVFPDNCRSETPSILPVGTALEWRWLTYCDGGLEGETLGVELLGASRTAAMVRFQPLEGKLQQGMLTAEAPSYIVPPKGHDGSVFKQYLSLGIKHILIGADHLLFVTGLLLLAGTWRVLLKTITAFTLGHSVTLALVSLEFIPRWPALVEFSIAATILFLALELSRPRREEQDSFTRRHQWLMASIFGLVHGLGFAGVLQDIGIPVGEVIPALLAFNIGIELGQLVFVSLASGLFYILWKISTPSYQFAQSASILVMGGFAVYWCLDRGTDLLRQLV